MKKNIFKIISNAKNKYGLSVHKGIMFQGGKFWSDLIFKSEEDRIEEIKNLKEKGYIEN